MTWYTEWCLWLLPLAVLPWLQGRKDLSFSSLRLLQGTQTLRARLAFLPTLLSSLGIALLIVAVARPGVETVERIVERSGLDIMLVVDTSGSMKVTDYRIDGRDLSRMDAAKTVMSRFVQQRRHDNLGMVVFGEEAFTYIPLTLDSRGAISFVRQLQVGMAGGQGTAVGDGIAIATQRLEQRANPVGLMILLTDGESNAGLPPLRAARAAAALGVRIYTIGIGSAGRRSFTRRRAGLDEGTLTKIAELTGGQYFRAASMVGLEEIYREIDLLEPTTAVVREQRIRVEKFQPWAIASMLCFLLHLLLSETWLRRLP